MGFLPISAAVASIYSFKPPYAIGSVSSLSGHATANRWWSLPRIRRHRASKPQGSSRPVLPWQVTMDQSICASLSHTHYWYELGMLKVPVFVCYNHSFFDLILLMTPRFPSSIVFLSLCGAVWRIRHPYLLVWVVFHCVYDCLSCPAC